MYRKIKIFILVFFLGTILSLQAQNISRKCYNYVYVAYSPDDNFDQFKLVNRLKELNQSLSATDQVVVFQMCNNLFVTTDLKEWGKAYRIIRNLNSLSNLDAEKEVNLILDVLKRNDFSDISGNRLKSTGFQQIVWHVFVGSGFWRSEYNKDILGMLVSSCGISDDFGTNFKLLIYNDNNDPLPNFEMKNALGRYFSFITEKVTEKIDY